MRRIILALFFSMSSFHAAAFEFNLNDLGKIIDAGQSLIKSYQDLTPEQEYYLGRAVAARLLSRFKPAAMPKTHNYLQSMVNYLVQFSNRPETYAGYHIQILKSDSPGAYSAPGGYIMVTTALLASCASEDELAGVIAHEIAHISQQHGLAAIKQANLTKAGSILGEMAMEKEGGKNYQQLQSLTKTFGSSVEDIVKTILDSGYSKSQETEADREAARMLSMAGYNTRALTDIVAKLANINQGSQSAANLNLKGAFAQTHPADERRLNDIQRQIETESLRVNDGDERRVKRFSIISAR
jgi:predicted Zn-dependent protease